MRPSLWRWGFLVPFVTHKANRPYESAADILYIAFMAEECRQSLQGYKAERVLTIQNVNHPLRLRRTGAK